MKKSKISILFCIALFLAVCARAEEIKIDFDGRNLGTMDILSAIKSESRGIDAVEMPAPESGPGILSWFAEKDLNKNMDYSILHTIKYCETNKIDEEITDNLKKLLVYGTQDEKSEFMKSPKYVFPKRLTSFRKVDFGDYLSINKGQFIQVCEETNCRTEEVCGWKEHCETVTEYVCTAVTGAAGGAIGGGATGGAVGAIVGNQVCKYVTKNVCKNVKECQDVVKCDTVCHWENTSDIQPGTCVNTSTGTVCQ